MAGTANGRGLWATRGGFILAAAGSAVGLGNIWKFPYVTGRNGGGLFVLVYLVCVVIVALPIMIAEILIGRATQRSPVAAFRLLTGKRSAWTLTGWMGVASGFVILSFYSVVAGWALYYAVLSLTRGFSGMAPAAVAELFSQLVANQGLNTLLHAVFMVLTVVVVLGGVRAGIERWSRILMPLLFVMLIGMATYGMLLPGRQHALSFMFGMRLGQFGRAGFLEALGQAFFSLSLGMGALTTYGSYLPKRTSILRSALWVAALDTLVALLASLMIFPITFSYGLEPSAGPGLVFQSLPLAFSQMAAGRLLSIVFFALLVFAALTSAISLLEVLVSTFIDVFGWARRSATLLTASAVFVLGVPSAMSSGELFGAGLQRVVGKSFFDLMDAVSSNWMLPLGGLLIALYVGWAMKPRVRGIEFMRHTPARFISPWLVMLRALSPAAVALILFRSTGLLRWLGLPS